MIKLYDSPISGNCSKVRLLLHQLGIAHERVPVDLLAGETRTPAFRAINPLGYVPVIEIAPGVTLSESNAILWYLADGSRLLPEDRIDRAQVLTWMFFEQNAVDPTSGRARAWVAFFGVPPGREAELEGARERGHAALKRLDGRLGGQPFLVGDQCTIADIALYAYTHVAPAGGVELDHYPAIRNWLERVRRQPGHVAMSGEAV